MDFESAKAQARASLESYVATITQPSPDRAANMWCCPLCGSGTHKNHTGAFEVIGEHWCCYVCDKIGGDIFDLAQKKEKLPDLKSAFRFVFKELHISLDKSGGGQMQTPKEKQAQAAGKRFAHILAKDSATSQGETKPQNTQSQSSGQAEKQIDFEGFRRGFEQSQAAQEYLTRRGISLDVAKRFNVGFWAKENELVFPLSAESYTTRNIDDNAPIRYRNPKGQAVSLFNAQSLYKAGCCFVCEGVFDALSFETAGFNAVSLNSANNPQKLFDYIDINGARGLATLIIATDFDFDAKDKKPKHAGEDAAAAIQSGLKTRGFISYRLERFPQECKDANEYLQKAGLESFRAYVTAQQLTAAAIANSLEKKDESAASPDNVLELIKANETHKKTYANIFVLDDDLDEWAVKLYKETGEAFLTVSDFLTLANDKELRGGIVFCCMESTKAEKQIGGKNEAVYLVDKANELKLFNVFCNDLRGTLDKYAAGDARDFQKAINECKARLNAQRLESDSRNKTYNDINDAILSYDIKHTFCPATFGGEIGFEKQNLAVIFARSGSGKTVALVCLAVEALLQRRRVIFLTLEETAKQIAVRLTLRRYAGLALKGRLETLETLDKEGRDPAKECYAMWQKAAEGKPLTEIELAMKRARDWLADKMQTGALRIGEHITTPQIEQYLRATARDGDLVLLDYLQIAKSQETERDRFAQVETVSHELTAIAKSQGVMMIVAAQANRNGAGGYDSEGNRIESLNSENIRDSDALFQDAAAVIGVGAKFNNDERIQARFFSIPKNRFQRPDTRYLEMNHALGFSYLAAMKDDNGELVVLKRSKTKKDAGDKSGKDKPKEKEVTSYQGGGGKIEFIGFDD